MVSRHSKLVKPACGVGSIFGKWGPKNMALCAEKKCLQNVQGEIQTETHKGQISVWALSFIIVGNGT